ncbi:mediator of RNA polymerase II transcription subunit 19-like isoform X2 [Varroa jacobsoni]|uniref:Mediator of RNA polymerase II transcription subunit 19 n=1 Tax=Varroa destructor TaxID=109461 RepID=A0A7M7JN59_VARDE|nr:mediator of RNA polymerase II transcription subunit 19-like isoform X1 [Varroa destructor]XP_022699265.1 mediator of RNA polymerase II transcription subunit 19-like isoform X2 [Varroa jacobsoni]
MERSYNSKVSPQFPPIGLMNDGLSRRPGDYSPRSSPRGNRSPVVSRPDSSGTLKTTISLRSTPAIVHSSHSGPFYLLKENSKCEQMLTGATNMMLHYNLEHTFNKFIGRKVKDKLSAFLPSLPGNIDIPAGADGTGESSLRKVIHQPPVGGKELIPLSGAQLAGFRLHPGPLPEQYRTANLQALKKKKHKKHRGSEIEPTGSSGAVGAGGTGAPGAVGAGLAGSGGSSGPIGSGAPGGNAVGSSNQSESVFNAEAEKKHKRTKKHDEERKKKKKDKKKKKTRHSPEPPGAGGPHTPTVAPNTPTGANMTNRVTI